MHVNYNCLCYLSHANQALWFYSVRVTRVLVSQRGDEGNIRIFHLSQFSSVQVAPRLRRRSQTVEIITSTRYADSCFRGISSLYSGTLVICSSLSFCNQICFVFSGWKLKCRKLQTNGCWGKNSKFCSLLPQSSSVWISVIIQNGVPILWIVIFGTRYASLCFRRLSSLYSIHL